jgi:hypothetical protein
MAGTSGIGSRGSVMLRNLKAVLFVFTVLFAFVPGVLGQTTTATLSGTVRDKDGFAVPQAKVVVTNRASKSTRTSTANGAGVFSFPALDSGDYSLTITVKGFETFIVSAIHLNPGDTNNVDSIKLKPGNVDESVTVDASTLNNVQDTGERSALITSKDLDKLSLEGREVTELLKILPGSAINTGGGANQNASSNSSFDPAQVSFGGAAGSYSMSGSPVNGASIRSDGANLTDPTSGAGALQTVNAESTAEVKVQTANFGADSANGPLVINAVGKSGSSDYHGSIYAYGRTSQLNANDSLANFLHTQKPPDRYIYPGGSIGGPIKIPGTNLNHSKRLTFFANGEDYIQRNVYAYNNVSNAIISALVPTPAMLLGDFSYAQISKYLPPGIPVCIPTPGTPCTNLSLLPANNTNPALFQGTPNSFQNENEIPVGANGTQIKCNGDTGNDCLSGHMDPATLEQFRSLFPSPNVPNGQTLPGAYNYIHTDLVDNDIYQAHGRLDYAKSDRQKFFGTFTAENGVGQVPQSQGYFASGNSGGVNTPGESKLSTYTYSGSVNWNATFSSTLTNEFYASTTYSNAISTPGNEKALFNCQGGAPNLVPNAPSSPVYTSLSTLPEPVAGMFNSDGTPVLSGPTGPPVLATYGEDNVDSCYPYTGAYNNGTKQFPDLQDYGYDGLPLGVFPDYSFGPLYSRAFVPGGGDNLTKLIRKHTVKVGVNVERALVNQAQQNNGDTNGSLNNYYTSPTFSLPDRTDPTGERYIHYHSSCYSGGDSGCGLSNGGDNQLASNLTGLYSAYAQSNIVPHIKLHAWTVSPYITDDWKILKNVSVTLGLRFEHIGRWTDEHGYGAAVFIPGDYAGDGLGSTAVPLPGFRWHSIDSSVPIGGWKTREFFYEPRVGFNWDVYGDGKTALSGGWGMYRFRDGQADSINSVLGSNGYRTLAIVNPGVKAFDPYNTCPTVAPCPGFLGVLQNSSLGGAGITQPYIQSLNISPVPGAESGTFVTTNAGAYPSAGGIFYGVDPKDSEAPLTTNYNATVTQQLPGALVFSIGYVGNNSNYLLDDTSGGATLANINAIPVAGLFQPNPNPGSTYYQQTFGAQELSYSVNTDDWRPYPHYSGIQIEQHKLTANYNALQVTLNRSKGSVYFGANYTFSKSLGIKGGYSNGYAGDSFNPRNDYGPLAYDRTQIFNAYYNFDFGSKYHGYRALRPVLNGWQINGITNVQSGPNLQSTNYSTNFGLGGFVPATPGVSSYPIENQTYLGTPDVSLQPLLTCDPRTNLRRRQYMRADCFALPPIGGANGPMQFPYIHGPYYFQSDLTLVKDFKVKEKQTLEFRAAAFNVLNHKLSTFSKFEPGELSLVFPAITDPAFGSSVLNSGRRVLELNAKYSF